MKPKEATVPMEPVNLGEVLEQAVASEIESRKFYEALACEVGDQPIRGRILALAQEEARHEAILLERFPGLIDMERVLAKVNPPQSAPMEKAGMTLASVISLAMERERESEERYKFLAESAGSHQGYLTLLNLAEYERQHKVKLQRELESLDPRYDQLTDFGRFL